MDGSNEQVVALLERIAAAQESTREEVSSLRDEVVRLAVGQERLAEGQERLTLEVKQTNRRLDNIVSFMGVHHADHEQRLRALEEHVFKKSG